ncbi:DUF3311 domain-containing protein [Jatrophihabitans endophyticus]|uniref:DUF3311 domain-containing protein n=1 Tax=Jatrophihabitans endophyticus TaxID=1206085 RepID=UPI0026EF35D2|nr:DUF3311 domain-containing protein [Jatrophihabitans endophyticus]
MSSLSEADEIPPPAPSRPRRLSVGTGVAVAVLLAIPCVALALVPLYSRTTPSVAGFPFFYWYQLLWVILTPILTWAAYLLIKRGRR